MKKFTTIVGLFAAISCADEFLNHKPIESVEGQFKRSEDFKADDNKSFALNSNKSEAQSNEQSQKVAQRNETALKNNHFDDKDDETNNRDSDVHKRSATRSCNGTGNEDLENLKHFNASARQGELASSLRTGNFTNHKSLEVNHEFTETAEHIDSSKDCDVEKVNSKKWVKRRHQKKHFNSNNVNHKRDHCVKSRGKGVSKHANEEQKDSKSRHLNNQEASDFANIQKRRSHTDVDLKNETTHDADKKEDFKADENVKTAESQKESLAVKADLEKKVEAERTFQVDWSKKN